MEHETRAVMRSGREYIIRKLEEEEIPKALRFVWDVFVEYESPEYGQEGTDEFYRSIHDEKFLEGLAYFGALEKEN